MLWRLHSVELYSWTHATWQDTAKLTVAGSRSQLAVKRLLLALGRKRRINRHVFRWQRNVLAGAHRISQRLPGIHSIYVHGHHDPSLFRSFVSMGSLPLHIHMYIYTPNLTNTYYTETDIQIFTYLSMYVYLYLHSYLLYGYVPV